ncbi:hypothetical protein GE061_003509 [Apolygus lucorum]|uniref:Uncharacterized protein n=1 Tax=Apolygus lucorum TaxID=248454 RepID=A0A8S9X6C3_APOLU|nr:hypothetical protein GE061_003509 [Apolygus lucorum]
MVTCFSCWACCVFRDSLCAFGSTNKEPARGFFAFADQYGQRRSTNTMMTFHASFDKMGGVVWSRNAAEDQPDDTPTDSVVLDDSVADEPDRKKILEDDMRRFKQEMAIKREARQEALKNLNKKISELQEEKEKECQENARLREELDKLKKGIEAGEVRTTVGTQENEAAPRDDDEAINPVEDRLESDIDGDYLEDKDEVIGGLERQVKALKDVALIGGEMLRIRELQVNELKSKLEAIEETGAAYEKEVENMKKLRNLYEERARAMTISHQMELEREKSKLLAAETRQKLAEHRVLELEEKNKELEEKLNKIDTNLDDAKSQISDFKIKLAGKNEDLYNATSQMAVVNHLFGQLLSPGQDAVEKITKVLEEHHDLVNHLTANGKINDLASTLVEIADKDPLPNNEEQGEDMSGHLSKVWRLLVELLGHHIGKPQQEEPGPESCYKSVDTPTGPKLVISVSQTFLRLKDLILEKNTLMKELGRLKDLNSTLETRLLEQESRLSIVTTELHSTWGVVNKLKRQHQNLHTNEQVLRYELAQKRLLLNELKKKLEECKDNWSLAREKNNQTEKDWKLLRSEFALRKQQASSAESGYEESPTDSQDEEDNWKDNGNNKSSSSSGSEDESDPCAVLAWNANEEPRTERRGTLTNSSSSTENAQSAFINFRVDEEVHHCAVLPWTDPEESKTGECSEENSSEIAARLAPSTSADLSMSQPSTSGASTSQSRPRTAEEIMQARQDRLRRLEEGCKGLFSKMSQTNQRSEIINSRLTELHEIYGDESRTRRRLDSEEDASVDRESTHSEHQEPTLAVHRESTDSEHQEFTASVHQEASASSRLSDHNQHIATSQNQPPSPPPFPEVPIYQTRPRNQPPSSTVDRPNSPNEDNEGT